MNNGPAQAGGSARRAWLWVALVFIVQLGLVLGLSNYSPMRQKPSRPAPQFGLASPRAAEWLALNDPSLFALPHAQSFSGLAWLRIPPPPTPASDWSEPPRLLLLPQATLGISLPPAPASSGLAAPSSSHPLPRLELPALNSDRPQPGPSAYRIEGRLAERVLLTPLSLPAWPSADLLANSVVQLLVNAQGRPISAALLSSSGEPAADARALDLAAGARFSPVSPGSSPVAELTWGQLVFEWRTVALPVTNAPSTEPPASKPKT